MIVAAMLGGLGNQMFQYANARALSLRNQTIMKIDCQYFDQVYLKKAKATIRDYELSVFNLQAKEASLFEINLLAPFISLKTKYSFAINKIINPLYISEKEMFMFHKLPSFKFLYLYGYWQSWRYFQDYEVTIRKDFSFLKQLEGKNLEICTKIKASNSISVHVRLGDYDPQNILPIDYYLNAINLMKHKFPDATFFIFSDDPQHIRHYFNGFDYILINENKGNNSYMDMQLMSLCNHHIIAKSSFSWWGAWLNNKPNKVVVAPSNWYNNADTNDIIPPDWIQL
jgi:hypothetical protein